MREFYLVNQNGESYYFSYRNNTLATDITGLGFDKDIVYLKYDTEYKKAKENTPLGSINMKLIFLEGYKGYASFLKYLKRSKELNLYYKSDDLKFCNIEIKSLSKEELVAGTIQSSIHIDRLSLWQKQKLYNMNIEKFDDNKSYPFKYPYTYSQSNRGTLTVSNEGSEKASLRIEIEGAVNNPELIITKDDKVLSRLRLYVVNSKCSIVVDSNVRNQIMTLKDSKGTKSIYENQDFEQDNFLFVDPGTYDLEFKPGVTTNTTCKIILTEFYLGN